jgi:hypothetical protein
MHAINQVLSQVSYWSVFVPLLLGVSLYRWLGPQSKWMLLLVFLAAIPQLMQAVWHGNPYRNLLFNLYTIAEFVVMIQVLKMKITRRDSRIMLHVLSGLFVVACVFFFSARGIGNSFISELVCLNSGIYLIILLAILREVYVLNLPFFERQDPFTYFFAGLLPYVGATLIFFALYNKIQESAKDSPWRIMNSFHSVLNSLMYLLIAVGFWVDHRSLEPARREGKMLT